ncbi:rRNA maturation RNase YbeY [Endozoicomonas euniceicola]|uniref:Endoribonuclease YbeY n=1 Tax=Endozoicomonas euniceicola TaxID=1234143 RepID=A0ABY6GMX3_9GAMM|nr:rRNA maturation RNase YbeY [Endozoicomonas euniceicola]UYM14080.1 rRNA maturation RNase YbeY [Endozoicomonas euniceicola]
MSANVFIDIQIASDSQRLPGEQDFQQWAEAAVGSHRDEAEISLRIVDTEEGAELNQQWRQKQGPTNVLSFPSELPAELELPLLGDLVVCAPVVEREAGEQKKSLQAHWAHMIIHGTLHLLGYDHIDDSEAEAMEALETEIVKSLGFPDPYAETV